MARRRAASAACAALAAPGVLRYRTMLKVTLTFIQTQIKRSEMNARLKHVP